jgi:beta-lactam-binding protein with PASTA domain
VPKVVGRTLGRAATLILRAHCRVGRVSRRHSVRRKRGKVLAQSPRAGKSLVLGARVKLVIGRR